jgi:hypothetical protein
MKIVRTASLVLLAAFIGTCAYLAYQSDPDRVQREIDKSPMVAPNVMHRVQGPLPCPPMCNEDVQRAIDEAQGERSSGNIMYKVKVPCWPICDDQHMTEAGKVAARIAELNNQWPIKKVEKPVPVDMDAFRRALERKNVIEVTDW